MKIQELAIIFIIIILPISLLVSEYTQFQIQTIKLQTEYDTRLTSATYDAIKAYQLNSINESYSDLANENIRGLEASVSAFRNSLMTAFELNGYTEDELNNYIPALVYTLYDGFYIYSPYENTNYRYETDEDGNVLENRPIDENGEKIYGLKPYINYSCRYKTSNIDVVITYALDNYVTVQGQIGNDYVNKSGYLIDGIEVLGNTVKYNGIVINKEHLKENVLGKNCSYVKVNGVKYYLVEDYNDGNTTKDVIAYISNGTLLIDSQKTENIDVYKSFMTNNDSAIQYYVQADEFTEWFKSTNLVNLKYSHAVDEVINDDGSIEITNIWSENTTKIFDFNNGINTNDNIENEKSNFNQHRLAVIRHKIETNLAIAISNYNEYSRVTSNVFQMPELKEDEWEHITNNVSLISFLQGLPIGGKIYNGYTLVTNSESKQVVLEEYIYILGHNSNDGTYNYHKVNDEGFRDGTITVDAGNYADNYNGAGRLNLDFKRNRLTKENEGTYYYYPLKDYNASYDSVVMQNNVTTYDDIYEYVNNCSNDNLKQAFYTALGRERYGMYKTDKEMVYYNILVVGTISNNAYNYEGMVKNFAKKIDEIDGIKATYVYNLDDAYLTNYINAQKDNYNLIIIDSFVWPLGIQNSTIAEIAKETNIITISNDATGLPMMQSGTTTSASVVPKITELGKNKFGNLSITGTNDNQAAFKFGNNVEVFYTGTYSGGITGEYDLIGCWKNGNYKWIHSQVSLDYNNANHIKLLKLLVNYALAK